MTKRRRIAVPASLLRSLPLFQATRCSISSPYISLDSSIGSPWALGSYAASPQDPTLESLVFPEPFFVYQPRQIAKVAVRDWGQLISPGDDVRVFDPQFRPAIDGLGAPLWVVESVDLEPDDDLIVLEVYEKELVR